MVICSTTTAAAPAVVVDHLFLSGRVEHLNNWWNAPGDQVRESTDVIPEDSVWSDEVKALVFPIPNCCSMSFD